MDGNYYDYLKNYDINLLSVCVVQDYNELENVFQWVAVVSTEKNKILMFDVVMKLKHIDYQIHRNEEKLSDYIKDNNESIFDVFKNYIMDSKEVLETAINSYAMQSETSKAKSFETRYIDCVEMSRNNKNLKKSNEFWEISHYSDGMTLERKYRYYLN